VNANAREVAFDLLNQWKQSKALADELLGETLDKVQLTIPDRSLVTELFYGCLRNKLALDFLTMQVASHAPRRPVAIILHLGLYQIFFLDKIPAHAAVHETVALAKRHASSAEAGFVNAALRRASNEREIMRAKLDALGKDEPWVFYSHPRWLFERWQTRWGNEQTIALCEWNNTPPSIFIRTNSLKFTGQPSSLAVEPVSFHPLAWKVVNAAGIFHTKSWKNGEFYVQDPSTLIAVDVLDPQPGERVLDVCSAPGGKTTYIAAKMQNRGEIIAADSSNSRLGLVGENCRRLGVTIVATIACEGTRLDRCLRGDQFDRVLVDAPCSNTGVLRRRVDLRWRIEEKEIARLAVLQLQLLGAAAEFTKPGGVLVYSTCSIEPDENERVVEAFGKSHPQFALETTRSTFPPRDEVDGAFVARWRRH